MNAIILAAGIGLRMKDFAECQHKALLRIGGVPVIERMIHHLHKRNIYDITIVIGFRHQLLLYLEEKYNVKLIYNKNFSLNNNMHSIEMVLDQIGDTYLIHGDVALMKNIFKDEAPDHSIVCTILKESKGIPVFQALSNKQRILQGFTTYIGQEAVTSPLGITYWTKEDAQKLRDFFKEHITIKMIRKFRCDWEEEILVPLCKMIQFEAQQIDRHYAKDINTVRDFIEASYVYEKWWKQYEQ